MKKQVIFSIEGMKRLRESKLGSKNPNFGKPTWNKGLKGVQIPSKETREKMSKSHIGNKSMFGKKHSIKTKKLMSLNRKGKNHWNWQNGKTPKNHIIRQSFEYKLWRIAVFERDNYTCIWCGKHGGDLEADHIKPFAYFLELRFAIDNGRTLCVPCHRKTETWGKRKL